MKTVLFATLLQAGSLLAMTQSEWNQLKNNVETCRSNLTSLIATADAEGLCTDYAKVSELVIRKFQAFAQFDRDNQDILITNLNSFAFSGQITPSELAADLPGYQLNACLDVGQHAIDELQRQLDGDVVRTPAPDMTTGSLAAANGYYELSGKPVFPSSINWLPEDEELREAFGRIGGINYSLQRINDTGVINSWAVNNNTDIIQNQNAADMQPQVMFLTHVPHNWMITDHPEITEGARHFTKYDIDSPLIHDWLETLFSGMIPPVCSASTKPTMHLLANEPHFSTAVGGWKASPLSDHSMDLYLAWLKATYSDTTKIDQYHATPIPIDPALRGTEQWYAWCRFNMDRVNSWFDFLKERVQHHDPNNGPTTIKLIGNMLYSPVRDHGMDIEYLTKLQEINGGDLKVLPAGVTYYGGNEDGENSESTWESRYEMDWVGQSMVLDFTKSLRPNQIFYDSEWHGFTTFGTRHFDMSRNYVRAALWAAFSHGTSVINAWVWGRRPDGTPDNRADLVGQLLTQPKALDAYGRTLKELNAHAEAVVSTIPAERSIMIYYNETCAIHDETYTDNLKKVYEAAKLLNIPVGFTTSQEMIEGKLSATDQCLIIPPTTYVSNWDVTQLTNFSDDGGTIVMVDESASFTHNKFGHSRSIPVTLSVHASLTMNEPFALADELNLALNAEVPQQPFGVESLEEAYGVLVFQSEPDTNGDVTVTLINTANETRRVDFSPQAGMTLSLHDSLSDKPAATSLTLTPFDVHLLKVSTL